jgi:RNA recognition motif-containing protein
VSIFVGNLPYEVSPDDLKQVFADYGTVTNVRIPMDRETGRVRGFAFVEMDTEEEETAAIQALDGAQWIGRNLKVSKARPREENQSFSNDRGDRNQNRRY